MDEKMAKPTWLRIAAAIILGGMVGGILFFIATLVIGVINNLMGMAIPINFQIAENVLSLGLLILLMGLSIAYFWWKVETTPPSEPETPEIPESEMPED